MLYCHNYTHEKHPYLDESDWWITPLNCWLAIYDQLSPKPSECARPTLGQSWVLGLIVLGHFDWGFLDLGSVADHLKSFLAQLVAGQIVQRGLPSTKILMRFPAWPKECLRGRWWVWQNPVKEKARKCSEAIPPITLWCLSQCLGPNVYKSL